MHRRERTNLITWPFTGIVPAQLTPIRKFPNSGPRRGPVADRPVLTAVERTQFFDHLLITVDAHRDEANALLRRQAIYLLGFDQRPSSTDWLTTEQHKALRHIGRADHVPSWVAVRSSAIALARKGNRHPLHAFVSTGLTNETQETANLNYWAYWVGEIPEIHANDDFMVNTGPTRWAGARLFEHLLNRLSFGSDHAELNIHTCGHCCWHGPPCSTIGQNCGRRRSA